MSKPEEPDYIDLVKSYQALSKGQQAEIRRASEPEALLLLPSYYQLIRKTELKANTQGCRVVWFLPIVKHQEKSDSLGRAMWLKDTNERLSKRLFQIVRSEYPTDLIQLRRVLQQIKPSLNWELFGSLLFYWGQTREKSKISKQTLMKDYYLKPENNKNAKGENHE